LYQSVAVTGESLQITQPGPHCSSYPNQQQAKKQKAKTQPETKKQKPASKETKEQKSNQQAKKNKRSPSFSL